MDRWSIPRGSRRVSVHGPGHGLTENGWRVGEGSARADARGVRGGCPGRPGGGGRFRQICGRAVPPGERIPRRGVPRVVFVLALAAPAWALAVPPRGERGGRDRDEAAAPPVELPDYCLAPNAAELLRQCPEGIDPSAMSGLGSTSAPQAAATVGRQQDRPIEEVGRGPTGPGIGQRPDDPRRRVSEARIEQLIMAEIELTRRLLRTTPDTAEDKPDIYFRLAQLYYEMQDNRNFQAGQKDMEAMMIEADNPNRAQQLYQQRDTLRAEALSWSDQAIAAYAEIVQRFDTWSKIDEALFYLAFAFEQRARDTDDPQEKADFNHKARTVYNVIIQQHSGSPYVANAYLSFAEYYFNDEGDMVKALEYYDKIIRLGEGGSNVYGYALYKMAWTLYNLQEFDKSLQTFERVIRYANDNPENPDSNDLRKTARMEMVEAYAQTGRPDQAWNYFGRHGGDLTLRMMQELGRYYFSHGEYRKAITAYHVLMDRDREGDALCDYQYWVTQCVMAEATTATEGTVATQNTKQMVVDEIVNMVEVWKIFVVRDGARHSPEAVKTCTWWAADFVIDTGVRWHREAAGTEQQPGTNDPRTMEKAAVLYNLFLENFGDPNSPYFYDNLEPPPEWEYQNPYSVYNTRYFAAELLWKAEKWEECGEAFDAVVAANPRGEYAEEAAYASVLCYKRQYDEQFAQRDRVLRRDTGEAGVRARERRRRDRHGATEWESTIPERRELTEQERAMATAFERYICYISTGEDVANVKFNRAFLYLDANQWAEAAVLFKDLAKTYSGATDDDDRRIAVLSAMNYFEIIIRLNRAGIDECAPEILDATNIALETQFPISGDGGVLENDSERQQLDLYLDAVPVFHCQQMLFQMKALADQHKWDDAANMALRIHDELPEKYPGYDCKGADGQSMMDDILDEAARYFENANKIGRAIQLRNQLVREYPTSDHVADAQYSVAQAYARLAFFEKSAEAYETFARTYRSDERAPEAMLYAVQTRIGLGHDQQAKTDADFLDSTFGSNRKYQKKAAEAYFTIGEMYLLNRAWDEVIAHYDDYLRKYGRKGGKEFEVRATMLIGQAYWEQSECPEDAAEGALRRCREKKNKAYDYATRANGLVDLPEYSAQGGDACTEQFGENPPAVLACRREATWNALIEELKFEDIEVESEAAKQAIIAAKTLKVADAVGRARFYIGEKLYEQFVRIQFPEFNPEDWEPRRENCSQFVGFREYMQICLSVERYKMWTEKKFVPFVQERDAKIQEARTYYDAIAYLQVPAWQIAASSRVGDMYLQFWKDLYAAPTPPAFQREEFIEAEREYRETLDNKAEPYKQFAIEAYGFCLITATREQWFSRYSQRCEEALYELDPGRFRVSNEFYSGPRLNRTHYALPDIDYSLLRTVSASGETVISVEVAGGATIIDDQGRYRFFETPAASAQAEGED